MLSSSCSDDIVRIHYSKKNIAAVSNNSTLANLENDILVLTNWLRVNWRSIEFLGGYTVIINSSILLQSCHKGTHHWAPLSLVEVEPGRVGSQLLQIIQCRCEKCHIASIALQQHHISSRDWKFSTSILALYTNPKPIGVSHQVPAQALPC